MSSQRLNANTAEQHSSERAIISTAINLLVKHQARPFSVSQLIKVSGVSRSSFYKYFASKEDLFAAILLSEEVKFGALLSDTQRYNSVSELLQAYLGFSIQHIDRYKLITSLDQNLQGYPDKIDRYEQWKAMRASHVDEFTRIVQSKLSKSKNLDAENLRFYYGLVWSIASGVAQLSDSDFYHQLIVDRRGFSKFLLESVSAVGDLK